MIEPPVNSRAETLRALRQLCRNPSSLVPSDQRLRLSTGIPALDKMLPGGGLECGSLVEWLVPVDGSGAMTLALQGVRPALEYRAVWAVVDPAREFYPPAVQGWGISCQSLLLHPVSAADIAWTVEQCLRCPAVGATWVHAETLTDRIAQRWKNSAEAGGGVGVLFRPVRTRCQASWANVRWLVTPQPGANTVARESVPSILLGANGWLCPKKGSDPFLGQSADGSGGARTPGRRLRVQLLACRVTFAGLFVELDVNDATGDVHLVSCVANPATDRTATEL